tara:strand:+ start:8224 stop:9777 length:1554 start_codon:yes stop_codon:yes gene_type:complete
MIKSPSLNINPIKIKTALISVYDKTGLVSLAKSLTNQRIKILSTGGTEKLLHDANLPVTNVSEYTNFPEIMDGRVKTINPLIEGGILGLRDKHINDAQSNQIIWIDLVVCNLYPFLDTISNKDCDIPLALENIDIGGPTMIRSAAKNMGWACVVVDPTDYPIIIKEINLGEISFKTRQNLSAKAFGYTAQYETIIHNYLKNEELSDTLSLTYKKHSTMRYGENPHQSAATYIIPGNSGSNILNAKTHQGKKLSYNNIMDSDCALSCIKEFDKTACVIVKHGNPCGAAEGVDLLDVYNRAFNSDSLSAFGGIIAFNRKCTKQVAQVLTSVFVEIVIAPSFEKEALNIFKTKKDLRILEVKEFKNISKKMEIRNLNGGILIQDKDIKTISQNDLKIVTKARPTIEDIKSALFSWKVLRHAKSNGILIAKDSTTIGLGAGQVSRVDAVHMALRKGGKNIKGGVLASDAFFPFRDSIDAIKDKGINFVIQPGGSIKDKEVIEACNEYFISMAFTGIRCFKH